MTSWIATSLPKKKVAPAPVSLFQMKEGTFGSKTKQATLVTTLYEEVYQPTGMNESFEVFLESIQSPVIVFTQRKFADQIVSLRQGLEEKTRVVVVEPSEWISVTKTVPTLWTQQVKQDPELKLARTVEIFQFAFEKKEFMLKAVTMNPFESTDFVWIDPAFFETKEFLPPLFPNVNRIPTDRIVVYNPEPFTADDMASSYFRGKRRIENLILAGSDTMWREYAKLYTVIMGQKLRINGFVGDDLMNLHYMILHKPNQFCLVDQSLVEFLN